MLKVATTQLQNSLFLGDGSVIIALTTSSVIFSFIIYLLPFTTRIDNRTNTCGYMWIGIYYFSLFLTDAINFWKAINHMKKINQLITLISMQWMEAWAYIHILEVQTALWLGSVYAIVGDDVFPALCNISTSLSVTFSSPSSEMMSLSRNLRMSVSLYCFVRRKTVREVNKVMLSKIRVNVAR